MVTESGDFFQTSLIYQVLSKDLNLRSYERGSTNLPLSSEFKSAKQLFLVTE